MINSRRFPSNRATQRGNSNSVEQLRLAKTQLWMTLIATLIGHAVSLYGTVHGQADKDNATPVVSCAAELDKALEVRRENPTVDITYSGELEATCNLNNAIRQVPVPVPVPTPRPT